MCLVCNYEVLVLAIFVLSLGCASFGSICLVIRVCQFWQYLSCYCGVPVLAVFASSVIVGFQFWQHLPCHCGVPVLSLSCHCRLHVLAMLTLSLLGVSFSSVCLLIVVIQCCQCYILEPSTIYSKLAVILHLLNDVINMSCKYCKNLILMWYFIRVKPSSGSSNVAPLVTCRGAGDRHEPGVQVSTVDAFQGGERPVIILSCVLTHSQSFLDSDK